MKKILIKGGFICDGTGKDPQKGDLLICGEKIEEIGGEISSPDAEIIKADGLIVAPGFIDAHAHSDTRKILYPECKTKLLQGVTTEVDGNCGSSPSCVPGECGSYKWNDLKEYIEVLEQRKPSVNTVILCGHNSLRRSVMGERSDTPTEEELLKMKEILINALDNGAAGFSSGLTYFPGKFAKTEELLFLADALKGTQKPYVSHIRSEGDDLLNAVDEAVKIAKAGSNRFQFSHIKTIFQRNFHKIDALLQKVDSYRKEGVLLTADRYPYVRSATVLHQILPPPYDKMSDIKERLVSSESFCKELEETLKKSPRDIPSTILVKTGKTFGELAEKENTTPEHLAMLALKENNMQSAVYLCMSEENLKKILLQEYVCAGSDGISAQLDDPATFNHPRAAGTFPTFFRMTKALLGTGEAVRRMTGLPAEIFHIPQRGLLKKGYIADIVIFDENSYDSKADFQGKNQTPSGVKKILVAGKTAFDHSRPEEIHRYGKFIAIK